MGTRTRFLIGGLALLVVACAAWLVLRLDPESPGRGDSVDLPQLAFPAGAGAADEVVGGLSASRDKRCVYLQPLQDVQAAEAPPAYAAIWPKGYEGRVARNGDFTVLDEDGHAVAREGEVLSFPGRWSGEKSDERCLAGARVFEVTAMPSAYYFPE